MKQQVLEQVSDVLRIDMANRFFELLKSNIVRTKSSVCIVVINMMNTTAEEQQRVKSFLLGKIRKTDVLFSLDRDDYVGLLLTHCGERETVAFLKRLIEQSNAKDVIPKGIAAYVTEVRNERATLEAVIEAAIMHFENETIAWQIDVNDVYKELEKEVVKVSIIENNAMFRNVLRAEVEKLQLRNFTLQIEAFEDGQAFLQSSFYHSAHTHLVIVNDLLPRKNGGAVLHHLRSMPNDKKFIVYMMTSRLSELEMILSYKAGVDQYLVKPFNLRLFEAQIERTFERLWR